MTNSSKSKKQGGRYSRGKGATGSRAQGRGGVTRDALPPARTESRTTSERTSAERSTKERGSTRRLGEGETFQRGTGRKAAPRVSKSEGPQKRLPQLRQVQLEAPPETAVFRDRDRVEHTFPDSKLRRVAAQILSEKGKHWRHRAFPFPIFTDRGHEQTLHFDFYIYDAEDTIIRLILVVPRESREVWDKVGRFKRQYPMYEYELWTPERLAALQGGRGRGSRLEF
ncbi:hypothetical protein GCM10017783_15340 [Deinococcus piscis]|uniref:Uncharacterized protein n=1 Tax=Deinococcus piscis TaxID=394230 RepID=A0ABQ3KBU4_9DEIO|nr:hypothetical protein [Deinococcus piscis]GHG03681.1 hypothetical protein GCM10017783_15340 [Deinococcus piscis]